MHVVSYSILRFAPAFVAGSPLRQVSDVTELNREVCERTSEAPGRYTTPTARPHALLSARFWLSLGSLSEPR